MPSRLKATAVNTLGQVDLTAMSNFCREGFVIFFQNIASCYSLLFMPVTHSEWGHRSGLKWSFKGDMEAKQMPKATWPCNVNPMIRINLEEEV